MKIQCPNYNHPDWKALEAKVGRKEAMKLFRLNNNNIPIIEKEINDFIGNKVVEAIKITVKKLNTIESKFSKEENKASNPEIDRLRNIRKNLENKLIEGKHEEGLIDFSKQVSTDIENIKKLVNLPKGEVLSQKANYLRNARDYLNSMIPLMRDINKYLANKERTEAEQHIFDVFSSQIYILEKLKDDIIEKNYDVFEMFLTPYLGDRNNKALLDEVNRNLPKDKQLKEFNIMESLKTGDKDIGFIDRWLKSMANSSDEILKLINEAVVHQKTKARLEAIEDRYKLLELREKLYKSGHKDFNFVYAKDKNGKLTGNFISDRRWTDWERDKYAFIDSLNKKYEVKYDPEEELSEEEFWNYKNEKEQWHNENSEKVGKNLIPNLIKYNDENYKKLSATQIEFLNEIMKMKMDFDNLIHPKFRHPYRVPMVPKDLWERMHQVAQKGQIKEMMHLMDRYDYDRSSIKGINDNSIDAANIVYTISNGNQEVELLPMYFTKKLDNMEVNLSTDIITSMVAYSNMAREYNNMNQIIDTLEIGRGILQDRKIPETDFMGRVKTSLTYVGASKIADTLFKDDNLALQRFEDYMTMIVYGKTKTEGKKFNLFGKKIDTERAIDLLGRYTAINQLALNIYSGMSNVMFGETMIRTEAIAGRYINMKDILKANKDYFSNLPSYMGQIGNVQNTSKMALWADRFNTLQDYEEGIHSVDAARNTWFARSMKLSSLFFLNRAGEHFMQNRMSYALANETKLLKNGKEISLFDAYIVKNNRLVLQEGITKLDGSNWTINDEIAFTRKQDYINQRLHGIYNKNDMAAFQKRAIGRIAMMFRKFILPGWDRRWEKKNFNYMINQFEEGYYKATSRFFWQLMKDMRHLQFNVGKHWKDLNTSEKANIKKSLTELSTLLGIALLLGLGFNDEPDKEDWLAQMTEYQARRLRSELMFFYQPLETIKLIGSPLGGTTNSITNAVKLTWSLLPFNLDDTYESGRYKDWYKWEVNLLRTLPAARTVDRAFHPEESKKYFLNW